MKTALNQLFQEREGTGNLNKNSCLDVILLISIRLQTSITNNYVLPQQHECKSY